MNDKQVDRHAAIINKEEAASEANKTLEIAATSTIERTLVGEKVWKIDPQPMFAQGLFFGYHLEGTANR